MQNFLLQHVKKCYIEVHRCKKNANFVSNFLYMYYSSSSEKPQSLYLWFYNSLNEEFRALSLCKFGDWIIRDNPIIIIDNAEKLILGYLIIREVNLTNSRYYNYFKENTINFQKIDPTKTFTNSKCYRVISWAFDIMLNRKEWLTEIFSSLAIMFVEKEEIGFIWTDNDGFLDYYPLMITNDNEQFNTLFVRHFVESFYQESLNPPE